MNDGTTTRPDSPPVLNPAAEPHASGRTLASDGARADDLSQRIERRTQPRASALVRWYYAVKYRAFRRERLAPDRRRGLIMLQIDALSYADLRRALELGYCPTIKAMLGDGGLPPEGAPNAHGDVEAHGGGHVLRRWFCGLPSATPYCQAGIFHGENSGIPAFRFYDKAARKVITCNAPHGVQYIRDRIHSPGALAGGSSYVNLLDGDASTVAFTVATRERLSVYRRLGGTRMGLLILLHPIRVLRMAVHSVLEYLREEWERLLTELNGRRTHSEGIFPFVRILSNVVVRELQTMAILLDIYLGVPVVYSTYMQYDELAHHFGPSSRQALGDLRRTDARISEIARMVRALARRPYDLVILSDHGMTPSLSYRVRFRESLGATVERMLRHTDRAGGRPSRPLTSAASDSEYADVGAQVMQAAAGMMPDRHMVRASLLRLRDWFRSRYGLREIILPEKYRVDPVHDVVVTYSSCLALVYFSDDARQLSLDDVRGDAKRSHLYRELRAHPGIGLLLTRDGDAVHAESRDGRARMVDGRIELLEGANPLERYGTEPYVLRAIADLVQQPNAGDIVLFGAYDGYDIVSFDDQVGAHGSAGGDQTYPFIIAPLVLGTQEATLENARDIHHVVMRPYMDPGAALPTPHANDVVHRATA